MNTFLTLIKGEARKGANWFKENKAAKLFVILGFLGVISGVVFAEYKIASLYLAFANEYAPFGPAVAVYSLKVAVFLLFIFAIVSSTAISSAVLYQNTSLPHLFTLPIKPKSIFMSRVVPGWLTSTMVLLLLIPLFLVYNKILFKTDNFVVVATIGLLMLSLASQAIGTILSTFVAYFFGRITRQKWLIILAFLLFGFLILSRLLFPTGMFDLAQADNFVAFQSQLDKLPLTGKLLPTNWLVDGLTGDLTVVTMLSASLAIFCLLAIVRTIGEKYYLTAWRRAQNQSFLAGNGGNKSRLRSDFPKMKNSKSIYGPLVINDLLSLVRSNAEVNYSLFLGGLLAILIFSINNLTKLQDTTPGLLLAVYLIAFVSVSLIFLISATRLIYPMMAKEKLTSWFSFSLPLSREEYLKEKLLVAILLGIPGLIAALIIVLGLRLSLDRGFVLVTLISATIVVINVLQCLLGAINPNFDEAENPEAVSTSILGILSLIISLSFIIFSTFQLNNYLHGGLNGYELAIRWIFAAIIIISPIILLALKSIKKYSL